MEEELWQEVRVARLNEYITKLNAIITRIEELKAKPELDELEVAESHYLIAQIDIYEKKVNAIGDTK